jgi:hypothetical protein
MLKKSFTAVALTLTLAWAAPASALDVIFDPSGTPGAVGDITIDVLDPTVGNSIALNANALSPVGAQITALFQANLGIATLNGTQVFANGDGGFFFTVVAGFHEVVLANSGGLFPTVTLGLDPNQPSFFDIYAVPITADNLNGTGFISGAPVLSGVFINSGAPGDGLTTFTFTSNIPVNLDGFNTDNYPAIDTFSGQGSFTTTVLVTGKNANYFPTLALGSTLALVTSQLKLNYSTVDPSFCFSNNGTTNCNQAGAQIGSIGALNGSTGPNTMFQTDASAAFLAVQTGVPEPATLTLLGIGGLAAGFRRRRNRATK